MQHLTATVRGLLLGTGAVWLAVELRQSSNYRPGAVKQDKDSRLVLRFATMLGFAAAIGISQVVPATAIRPAGVAAWIGLGILWCGIGLRFWCFRTLGRYFTFTVQTSGDQPVISAGPYRVIRHPSYAAILLAVTGLGLFIANWLSLISLTAAVVCGLGHPQAAGSPYKVAGAIATSRLAGWPAPTQFRSEQREWLRYSLAWHRGSAYRVAHG